MKLNPTGPVLGQIRVGSSYFDTSVGNLDPVNGTSDWYRRVENNDWRPITQRVLQDAVGSGVRGQGSGFE